MFIHEMTVPSVIDGNHQPRQQLTDVTNTCFGGSFEYSKIPRVRTSYFKEPVSLKFASQAPLYKNLFSQKFETGSYYLKSIKKSPTWATFRIIFRDRRLIVPTAMYWYAGFIQRISRRTLIKYTWSYENRVSKHFVIFFNFPCLKACLLRCLLLSFFCFCLLVVVRDLCRSG